MDGIDAFRHLVSWCMALGMLLGMFKRDVKSAYRRVPIRPDHLQFSGVVWSRQGRLWWSRHLTMPFGAVASVFAWHRLCSMLVAVCRQILYIMVLRFVDDMFGVSRQGLASPGKYISMVAQMMGIPCDEGKSADLMSEMAILGCKVSLNFSRRLIRVVITSDKTARYTQFITRILQDGVLTPSDASRLVGKLGFAVSTAADRQGRAFMKPLYAQIYNPTARMELSPWARASLEWWRVYLTQTGEIWSSVRESRQVVQSWTDAAGDGTIAAVVHCGGKYFYTWAATPTWLIQALIPRANCQIEVLELAAVLLCLGTFGDLLQSRLWLSFNDNDAARGSLNRGTSGAEDMALLVGRFWMTTTKLQTGFFSWRVHTKSNIADGPTRNHWTAIRRLQAQFRPARFPRWVRNFWRPLGLQEDFLSTELI